MFKQFSHYKSAACKEIECTLGQRGLWCIYLKVPPKKNNKIHFAVPIVHDAWLKCGSYASVEYGRIT